MRSSGSPLSELIVDDRYVVVSSDGHAGADRTDYRLYLAAEWREEFDAWCATYETPFSDLVTFDAERSWNSDRRTKELEAEGIVAEVLFPQTLPPFFTLTPPTIEDCARRWAGLQAHNRWLVDFCSLLPGRRAGVAQLMLHDVDAAVREVRWVKESGLSGGVLVPVPGLSDPVMAPLYAPEHEPLWSVCEELGVVVHTHGGFNSGLWGVGRYPAAGAVYLHEGVPYTHRALGQLVFAGVFQRHPGLRFVMAEQGTGWVLGELRALDRQFEAMTATRDTVVARYGATVAAELTMRPSDYFARNCAVGSSFLRRAEALRRHDIGLRSIMWGADYPHSEGTYPFTAEALRWTFAGIDPAEVALMLGENALRLYGFDRGVLRACAARVGPEVTTVARRLDGPPHESLSGVFTDIVDFSEEGCVEPPS